MCIIITGEYHFLPRRQTVQEGKDILQARYLRYHKRVIQQKVIAFQAASHRWSYRSSTNWEFGNFTTIPSFKPSPASFHYHCSTGSWAIPHKTATLSAQQLWRPYYTQDFHTLCAWSCCSRFRGGQSGPSRRYLPVAFASRSSSGHRSYTLNLHLRQTDVHFYVCLAVLEAFSAVCKVFIRSSFVVQYFAVSWSGLTR